MHALGMQYDTESSARLGAANLQSVANGRLGIAVDVVKIAPPTDLSTSRPGTRTSVSGDDSLA